MLSIKQGIATLTVLSAMMLSVGCKESGSVEQVTKSTPVTAVKVAGDSLADSGTFGYKFTIQGSAPVGVGSSPIWPELVAESLGVTKPLCNYYKAITATTFEMNSASCTNYAIGGSTINVVQSQALALPKSSIIQQLMDMSAGLTENDVVLIDGGGNDAAAVIGRYAFSGSTATAFADWKDLMTSLDVAVDASIVNPVTKVPVANSADADIYMVKLANKFAKAIKDNVTSKGVKKVMVLDMPTVVNTPKLAQLIKGVEAGTIKGYLAMMSLTEATATPEQLAKAKEAGAMKKAEIQKLASQWVMKFNTQLRTALADTPSIVLVEFGYSVQDQITHPAQYGFSNAVDTACAVTGVTSSGLPDYNFKTCTLTNTVGKEKYAFADNFHPTPYAHSLISQLVARNIAQAGWL